MNGILYNDKKFSDYIICDKNGGKLYLHKVILANNYKYFNVQFSEGWKNENELIVENIKPYDCVMRYLYSKESNFEKYEFTTQELNDLIIYSNGILLLIDDLNFREKLQTFIPKFLANNKIKIDWELIKNIFDLVLPTTIDTDLTLTGSLSCSTSVFIKQIKLKFFKALSYDSYLIIKNYLTFEQNLYYSLFVCENHPEHINKIQHSEIRKYLNFPTNDLMISIFLEKYGVKKMRYFFDSKVDIINVYPLKVKILIGNIITYGNSSNSFYIQSIQSGLKKNDNILVGKQNFTILDMRFQSYDHITKMWDINEKPINIFHIGMNPSIELDKDLDKTNNDKRCYLLIDSSAK